MQQSQWKKKSLSQGARAIPARTINMPPPLQGGL
jgi:hypothetical protein